MNMQIFIHNGARMLEPAAEQGIEWITERKGVPGKLVFSALQDSVLEIAEGNSVALHADGKPVFTGYIFRISRDGGPMAKITAYDQLRYLKNKDIYVFDAAKASDMIAMIGGDYGLKLGEIADTGYVIPSRVEENTALIDMMQTALEITLQNTRQMFVLYDDCGSLTLKNAADMHVGLIVDAQSVQGLSYDSSIDGESYNRIKLVQEGDGKRKIIISADAESQKKWGTLQLFETISDLENAQARADAMLKLYNAPEKTLKLSGVLGDLRVRAGSFIILRLELADETADGFMLVETCRHKFDHGLHTMDLTLRGGDFTG